MEPYMTLKVFGNDGSIHITEYYNVKDVKDQETFTQVKTSIIIPIPKELVH